ncbi:GntR family transcriptional regulator [Saccharopolyspora spinosa]|uniref:GntR family transcriptional regulator n=1 Tax=Saccharopolyspora spinosa TaxID=60894 RepID=A0A2N3XZI7_SACSN|nr:GntR family transcriptional regulator [Saccharopolyspora spinosa]PKW16059.1 GntR family transcriptional regulator [Saccharopolyspora spinosa]
MAADHTLRRGSPRNPNDIADELRTAIVNGVFPPGHRLVHEELAARFGVSRIPLREAIRTLVGEGLVQSPPGRGTFVTELDLAEIDEIYDLRKLVEPSFAEHVVQRCSRADVGRLRSMTEQMDRVDNLGSEGWSRVNFAFHLDMYRLAGLPMRYEVISRLYHQLEPYSRFYVHSTHALDRVQAEHKAMVAALADGDATALADQIHTHIDGGQQGLRTAWHDRAEHPESVLEQHQ